MGFYYHLKQIKTKNQMKVKLLKKVRARFTMYCDPNRENAQYVMKVNIAKWYEEPEFVYNYYYTKSDMFTAYRKIIIRVSGSIYGCYKQVRRLPIIPISHSE